MSGAIDVNRPTNKKLKDEDVSRKLQLYGIYSAFQNGKVPSVSMFYASASVFAHDGSCTRSPGDNR